MKKVLRANVPLKNERLLRSFFIQAAGLVYYAAKPYIISHKGYIVEKSNVL